MTTSLILLSILGVLILLVGIVVFAVSAFRVSLGWGFAVLFVLPAPVFLLLHWSKARDGFVIVLVGLGLPLAAARLLLDAEDREKLQTDVRDWVTNYYTSLTSPDPFSAQGGAKSDASGAAKKPPPAIPQTQVLDFSSVGGAQAPTDVGIRTPTTVIAPTAGLLENEAQITAAYAELTQKSKELSRKKEQIASAPPADQILLRNEIEAYNKRLGEVKAAELRIFQAKQQAYADQRLALVPKNKLLGNLQGRQVVFDSAVLDRKRAMLTFRQGDEKSPDVTLTVMFGGRVDEPFDKRRVIRDPAPDNSPAVSFNFRKGGSKSYSKGYGLYVDFAEDQPEGRIFLTLPDDAKSQIQGTFRLGGTAEKKSG